MKLEKLEINTMGLSYEPEFHITMNFEYEDESKLILKHNGYIILDRYRVAFLHEYTFGNLPDNFLNARNTKKGSKWAHQVVFVAPFSRQVLDKFEEKRNRDPKGDLKFQLILNITCLEPTFNTVVVNSAKTGRDEVDTVNLEYGSLLKTKSYNYNQEVRISSSDWIHDFVPVFENGKYQVFELPLPKISSDKSELGQRINEAILSIKEMEEAKSEGEWNNVVKASRPVWELIKSKTEIAEILKNDNINDQAVESFSKLVDSLFDFSSKFTHKVSKTKEVMSNKASKEDAELVYALSISIVNLITKKMKNK